jgi:hypothetical protein
MKLCRSASSAHTALATLKASWTAIDPSCGDSGSSGASFSRLLA